MGGSVMSRLIIVGAGMLYPAYSSYKAVKGANIREYVRWIMYWVVFALFTAAETFTDVFLSWLPFYYEVKIVFVLWLMLPYSKGATVLYRKFIHPNLSRREQEIDLFLENARERSYETMVNVGSRGLNLAANAVATAAVKGQTVVNNRLKSYSVMDLTSIPENQEVHRQSDMQLPNPRVVRERRLMTSDPATETDGGPSMLPSQFKAYSMMNLSTECSQDMEAPSALQSDEEFCSEPPAYTIDDMQITRRSNYAEESVPNADDFNVQFYPTMPKQRKSGKSKTKQMPPFPQGDTPLRRSKRTSKTRAPHQELS